MVEIPFLFLEIVFTAIWLMIRIAIWINQKRIDWKRETVLLLMYINLAVILRFTFFPMSKVDGRIQPLVFDIATTFPFRVNLLPLVNLFDYDSKRDLLLNVIGNAAMFIPSGIVLPIVYKRLNTFWKVLTTGIGISLCIEINLVKDVEEKGLVSVSDCCCGAGCLLIAFANSAKRAGVNYQRNVLFVAQDVDLIAGLMCYIQLSILGCKAYIKIGNSLTEPITTDSVIDETFWFTPMYRMGSLLTFMELFDETKNENFRQQEEIPA